MPPVFLYWFSSRRFHLKCKVVALLESQMQSNNVINSGNDLNLKLTDMNNKSSLFRVEIESTWRKKGWEGHQLDNHKNLLTSISCDAIRGTDKKQQSFVVNSLLDELQSLVKEISLLALIAAWTLWGKLLFFWLDELWPWKTNKYSFVRLWIKV